MGLINTDYVSSCRVAACPTDLASIRHVSLAGKQILKLIKLIANLVYIRL